MFIHLRLVTYLIVLGLYALESSRFPSISFGFPSSSCWVCSLCGVDVLLMSAGGSCCPYVYKPLFLSAVFFLSIPGFLSRFLCFRLVRRTMGFPFFILRGRNGEMDVGKG